jgi:hypothetical protein
MSKSLLTRWLKAYRGYGLLAIPQEKRSDYVAKPSTEDIGALVNETNKVVSSLGPVGTMQARETSVLVGVVWANFEEWATSVDLAYITEATENGTRYIVDFADLPKDCPDGDTHIHELHAVVKHFPDHHQIILEVA